jgi:hypothetical protein
MMLHEERFGGHRLALGGGSLAKNTSAVTLFADHGYLQARVDADSPTGAFGLYGRLGFVVRESKVSHRKLLGDR